MPVLDKKAYAGDRDPKPDPECSYGIAQADCVPVFNPGNMRLREPRSSRVLPPLPRGLHLAIAAGKPAKTLSLVSSPGVAKPEFSHNFRNAG
jgi:hypothetical protein